MSQKPILGYWNIRGWAESIRYLLYNLGIEYEERVFVQDATGKFDGTEYFQVKYNLGLVFPNLPYYIDGEDKVTYSQAILQFICRKYRPDYLGRTPQIVTRAQIIGGNIYDLGIACFQVFLFPGSKERIPMILPTVRSRLKTIAQILENTKFLADNEPTWIDFGFYEFLQMLEKGFPGLVAQISTVFERYKADFQQLPGIIQCEQRVNRPERHMVILAEPKIQ